MAECLIAPFRYVLRKTERTSQVPERERKAGDGKGEGLRAWRYPVFPAYPITDGVTGGVCLQSFPGTVPDLLVLQRGHQRLVRVPVSRARSLPCSDPQLFRQQDDRSHDQIIPGGDGV
jgi:hypothetical protein